MNDNTTLERCDVAIIGAGVAGLSVAERLAREAARQQREIRIIIVEKHDQVGAEASSGLEGWFHTGALYSKSGPADSFNTCVKSFEDLYNWYRSDPLFLMNTHCNLRDITETRRPQYGESLDHSWFRDLITYIIPVRSKTEDSTEKESGGEWARVAGRAKHLVHQTFFEQEWLNELSGCCRAPDSHNECLWAEGSSTKQSVSQELPHSQPAAELTNRRLSEVRHHLAKSESGTDFETMLSMDSTLNSGQVLRDLTELAMLRGVKILRGYKMEMDSILASPPSSVHRVNGVVLTRVDESEERFLPGMEWNLNKPERIHLIANDYIFAIGRSFDDHEHLHKRLHLNAGVRNEVRVMVVAEPPLCEHSFARMDPDASKDFNHLYRSYWTPQGEIRYSIMADSETLPSDANLPAKMLKVEKLLEKAERYFGEAARKSSMRWYTCEKTVLYALGDPRDYSFYVGPRGRDWESPEWKLAREQNRAEVAAQICALVYANSRDHSDGSIIIGGVPLHLGDSSWALRKALKFSVQQVMSAERKGDQKVLRVATDTFTDLRDHVLQKFGRMTTKPNFLCVVPGKFSLFPSLATEVYLELETRGVFGNLPRKNSTVPLPPDSELVDAIVARPHAEESPQLGKVPSAGPSTAAQVGKNF